MDSPDVRRIDTVLDATDELIAFVLENGDRIGDDQEMVEKFMRLRQEHARFLAVIDALYRDLGDFEVVA